MMEIACKSCGAPARVSGFLAAAERKCDTCGKLLLGGSAETERVDHGSRVWVGMVVGAVAGLCAVTAFGHLAKSSLPAQTRIVCLASFSGVLFTPIFIASSFLSMVILPFSIEGMLGGTLWERLARAHNRGSVLPLLLPFLYFVALPMALCGFGATLLKQPDENGFLITACIGAMFLGAIIGIMAAAACGPRNPAGGHGPSSLDF